MVKRRIRGMVLWLINHLLVGNRFWNFKRWILNSVGISVGKGTKIVAPIKIGVCGDLSIGENCWIGKNCCIYGNGRVTIGNNCDLAPNVDFATGTHQVGTHERRAGEGYCESIQIGNGCWIGLKSTILSGVIVGDGTIIGAGAVVTKSFDGDVIIGGVPGSVIRQL